MQWLPTMAVHGTCCCEPEGDWEGRTLQLRWLWFVFEFTIGTWEDRIDGR